MIIELNLKKMLSKLGQPSQTRQVICFISGLEDIDNIKADVLARRLTTLFLSLV